MGSSSRKVVHPFKSVVEITGLEMMRLAWNLFPGNIVEIGVHAREFQVVAFVSQIAILAVVQNNNP